MKRNPSMAIVLTILATASLTTVAPGRVGENRDECKARYGFSTKGKIEVGEELVESGSEWELAIYSVRGLKIQVVFEAGKAVFIQYSNEPVFSLRPGQAATVDLTRSEIDYLRAANAAAKETWKIHRDAFIKQLAPGLTTWRTSKSELYAGYDRNEKQLFVCTKAFWDLVTGKLRERYGSRKKESRKPRFEGL